MLVALAGLIAIVVVWRMTWMAPTWWSPPDPQATETRALAQRVEYRLAQEAHEIRPRDEAWWIRIRERQANAWLAARLDEWLAHAQGVEWPGHLEAPHLRFRSGSIDLGFSMLVDGRHRYVTANLVPRIIDGELAVGLDGVSLGRVAIPGARARTVARRLRDDAPPDFLDEPHVRDTLRLVLDQQRLDPVLKLSDGRWVRLIDVRCEPGAMLLGCRTLEAAARRP